MYYILRFEYHSVAIKNTYKDYVEDYCRYE